MVISLKYILPLIYHIGKIKSRREEVLACEKMKNEK